MVLVAPDGNSYAWSNGETGQTIMADVSGIYSVTVTRTCSDAIPEGVEVTLIDPSELTTEGDAVLPGGECVGGAGASGALPTAGGAAAAVLVTFGLNDGDFPTID